MAKPANLRILDEKEQIARILFTPSMVLNDRVAPSAFALIDFKDGSHEDYLSVWRLALRVPLKENVTFHSRTDGDTFYGYAELNVGVCHNINVRDYRCKIKVNVNSPNKFHAGIYYTDGERALAGAGDCYSPYFLMLASYLASKSTLTVVK